MKTRAAGVLFAVAACTPTEKGPAPSSSAAASVMPAAPSAPASAAKPTFRFAWKVPCRVPVEERIEKDGVTMRARFTLSAKSEGDEVLVNWDGMQIVEVNGQAMTPELQSQLAPLLVVMLALPTLVVSRDGHWKGARGMNELLDRMIAAKLISPNPEAIAAMRSPQTQAAVSASVGDQWNAWVGAWIGWTAAPGDKVDAMRATSLGGREIPTRVRAEHLGTTADGTVRLAATTTIGGEEAMRAVAGFAEGLTPKAKGLDAGAMHLSKVTRVEVETDPATLQPRRARYAEDITVEAPEKTRSSRTVREDRFDWSRAEGCK